MKRFISLLLSLLLILYLAACGMPISEPAETSAPEQTAEPAKSDTPPADEYERAIWYGFVSEELALR